MKRTWEGTMRNKLVNMWNACAVHVECTKLHKFNNSIKSFIRKRPNKSKNSRNNHWMVGV